MWRALYLLSPLALLLLGISQASVKRACGQTERVYCCQKVMRLHISASLGLGFTFPGPVAVQGAVHARHLPAKQRPF